ncbi:hypothetical protein EVAR_21883_1 [Eumeta japonica]|uniref:Uncharacterized protein n=1 Tax=Eumeta variegata TaxID=151549 RepID=A0A4C1V956_EUMVA|nr:hypothetical protein EVAR_21883_1 [Eumeta japonica]
MIDHSKFYRKWQKIVYEAYGGRTPTIKMVMMVLMVFPASGTMTETDGRNEWLEVSSSNRKVGFRILIANESTQCLREGIGPILVTPAVRGDSGARPALGPRGGA